jgi:hypothetical protein
MRVPVSPHSHQPLLPVRTLPNKCKVVCHCAFTCFSLMTKGIGYLIMCLFC